MNSDDTVAEWAPYQARPGRRVLVVRDLADLRGPADGAVVLPMRLYCPAGAAGHGFALGGGNALIQHGVISRPTQDVGLSTDQEAGGAATAGAVEVALREAGFCAERQDMTAGLVRAIFRQVLYAAASSSSVLSSQDLSYRVIGAFAADTARSLSGS